jgi:putative oxidoreductase
MQRLFSTFANGLPGVGLLLQRLLVSSVLIQYAIIQLRVPAGFEVQLLLQATGVVVGVFLLLGLWTPIAGSVSAVLQVWAFVSGTPDPRIPILMAMLGVSLALIGPGAWSIDARIFGRKQIWIPQRKGSKPP